MFLLSSVLGSEDGHVPIFLASTVQFNASPFVISFHRGVQVPTCEVLAPNRKKKSLLIPAKVPIWLMVSIGWYFGAS